MPFSALFGHSRKTDARVVVIKQVSVRRAVSGRPSGKPKTRYEQIRLIGEGGQGKTWLMKRIVDGKLLVRKEQLSFVKHDGIPYEMYLFEQVMTPHPRVVGFDHASYSAEARSLSMYFEYGRGGDLDQFIDGGHRVSESFMWQIFIQLADALAFLHYGINRFIRDRNPPRSWRRIVHRDIKPENVFLLTKYDGGPRFPDLVLGDFGVATLEEVTTDCGTDLWIGPEIPTMTAKGDVWGLGAIIHALAHGEGPIGAPPKGWPRGRAAEDRWLRDPGARRPRRLPQTYSSALNNNVMDCLTKDMNGRVSSRRLLENLLKDQPRSWHRDGGR